MKLKNIIIFTLILIMLFCSTVYAVEPTTDNINLARDFARSHGYSKFFFDNTNYIRFSDYLNDTYTKYVTVNYPRNLFPVNSSDVVNVYSYILKDGKIDSIVQRTDTSVSIDVTSFKYSNFDVYSDVNKSSVFFSGIPYLPAEGTQSLVPIVASQSKIILAVSVVIMALLLGVMTIQKVLYRLF